VRLEESDHVQLMVAARAVRIGHSRAQQLRFAPVESGGQHADDRVRGVVEAQTGADHPRVSAEHAPPQRVGNDRDVQIAAGLRFVGLEVSAERW
jgi:hypothetical protein